MRWKTAAALYRMLDRMPYGHRIHYLAQRHLLGTFPISDERLEREKRYASRHLQVLIDSGWRRGEAATILEFGAGRHLAVALCLADEGADVITTDVTRLMQEELVQDAARRLGSTGLAHVANADDVTAALRSIGLEYRLMPPSSFQGVPDSSVDMVLSTSVIEHVPEPQLGPLLAECRRVLRDDGHLSLIVDYNDHYSYGPGGTNTPRRNFLTIPEKDWFTKYSPANHFQNRLRHAQVIDAIEAAGFGLECRDLTPPNADDLAWLAQAPLVEPFAGTPPDELGVSDAHLVGRLDPPPKGVR